MRSRPEPIGRPALARKNAGEAPPSGEHESTGTVLFALAANLLIAVAKLIGGVIAGSSAMLSEAAHSVADTTNQVLLLVSLRRSGRPADVRHPFGYGKERYVWSMLAAVGIFVTGACFSAYEGLHELSSGGEEGGYYPLLYAILGISVLAEGSSLLNAVAQVMGLSRSKRISPLKAVRRSNDTALTTVLAEDSAAVAGLVLAAAGLALHQVTGSAAWEGAASLAIAGLLAFVAFQLGRQNMDLLIGQSASATLRLKAWDLLAASPGVQEVLEVQTMQMAPAEVLLAARVDLTSGVDSERVEELAVALRSELVAALAEVTEDRIFLDVTDATPASSAAARDVYAALRQAVADL